MGVKAVRRRRRGGNVGIPRFVRDFQGWGESGKGRVWTFPRFPRPAISTAGVRSAAWLLVLSHSAGKSQQRAVPRAGSAISKKPRRMPYFYRLLCRAVKSRHLTTKSYLPVLAILPIPILLIQSTVGTILKRPSLPSGLLPNPVLEIYRRLPIIGRKMSARSGNTFTAGI